jgi:hypothetical protein
MKKLRHMGMGIIALMNDEQYAKSRRFDFIVFSTASVVCLIFIPLIIWYTS